MAVAISQEVVIAKAKELGATEFRDGTNWAWCCNFPTRLCAEDFTRWLDQEGYEHRGIYPPDRGCLWSVRYRSG